MGAYRCSVHHLSFPYVGYGAGKCPVEGCNTKPLYVPNVAPDTDWEAKAADLGAEVTFEEPKLEIPNVDTDVVTLEGRAWVPHEVLIEAGYRNLEDFCVVKVRGRFYELQAHVGRSVTHGIRGGAWWVEGVDEAPELLTPALFAASG